MINIGIYADLVERNNIKTSIIKYLENANIEANINYIKTLDALFHDFFQLNNKYNIIITCAENKLKFIKINSVNYGKNVKKLTSGILEFPLSSESIDEMMLADNGHNCPHGIYEINSKKTFRLVPHEDIEYFYRSNGKTMVFMKNNETEEIFQTKKAIKKELAEDYFVDCAKGYIVNIFNIKKIDKINQIITLQSDNKIPISRKKFQYTFRMLIKAKCGIELYNFN